MSSAQISQAAVQIREQFQAQAAALLAQFERLANIRHRQLSGVEREGPVREFLRTHLPGRFLVATGSIASALENPGGQHDVVIADAQHSMLLLAATSACLFAIESVHAIVEVKSGPDLELPDIGKSLARLRTLRPETCLARYAPLQTPDDVGQTAPPVHTVFAYRGPKDPNRLIKALRTTNGKHTQPGGRCVIDFILVLSATKSTDLASGYVVGYSRVDLASRRRFNPHYYPVKGEQGLEGPIVLAKGPDSFAFWFASLLNHLSGVVAFPPNLYRYLGLPVEIVPT
jgi:hypothetical protein